jgi:hypothetical protein
MLCCRQSRACQRSGAVLARYDTPSEMLDQFDEAGAGAGGRVEDLDIRSINCLPKY